SKLTFTRWRPGRTKPFSNPRAGRTSGAGRTRNKGAARRRPRHPRPGPGRSARTVSSFDALPRLFLEPAQVTPVLGRSGRCPYAQRARAPVSVFGEFGAINVACSH